MEDWCCERNGNGCNCGWEEYKLISCPYCGREGKERYDGKCHSCHFWLRKVELSEEDRVRQVIVDNIHYMIGKQNTSGFKGFGGREFIIQFFDGRIVETSNLWHQGEIPERFRSMLPDNAVFKETNTKSVSYADNEIPF